MATDAEIRIAVFRAWHRRPPNGLAAAADFSDGFTGALYAAEAVWDYDELRTSEHERLQTLVYDAIQPLREQAERQVLEAMAEAAIQFAAEFPNAPRAATPKEADR